MNIDISKFLIWVYMGPEKSFLITKAIMVWSIYYMILKLLAIILRLMNSTLYYD